MSGSLSSSPIHFYELTPSPARSNLSIETVGSRISGPKDWSLDSLSFFNRLPTLVPALVQGKMVRTKQTGIKIRDDDSMRVRADEVSDCQSDEDLAPLFDYEEATPNVEEASGSEEEENVGPSNAQEVEEPDKEAGPSVPKEAESSDDESEEADYF